MAGDCFKSLYYYCNFLSNINIAFGIYNTQCSQISLTPAPPGSVVTSGP